DEKEALEKDLDDIQRDYSDEREALVKEVAHWQERSKALEETLERLRSENEGAEADARWENAKLVTEKLALRDEIRRCKIELALNEDEKSKLLDLTEALQESHVSLDALHGKLFDTYRDLAQRFVEMTNSSDTMQMTVEELKEQSARDRRDLKALRASAQSDAQSFEKYMTDMEDQQIHVVGELEAQLTAASALSKELKERVAKLETENRRLMMSQTAETKDLQKTVAELTSHLEFSQQEMMSENAALAERLRMAERAAKRLETENARMAGRMDAMAAGSGMNGSAQASWEREREQLTAQVKRLRRAAEKAEQRAQEAREDGDSNWAEWQREKKSADERHRRLTTRLQEHVNHAADVNSALDDERTNGVAMPPSAAMSRRTRNISEEEQTLDQMMSQLDTDDSMGMATATKEPVQQPAQQPKRRGRPAGKKAAAVADGAPATSKTAPANTPARRGRGRGRPPKHTAAGTAAAATDDVNTAPKGRTKRVAARNRKTIVEMDTELMTQPAQKREGKKAGHLLQQPSEENAASSQIDDTHMTPTDKVPRAPSPKRKHGGLGKITLGAVRSGSAATGVTLKKKRRLNMRDIQNNLSTAKQAMAGAGKLAATAAPRAKINQPIQFVVAKLRSGPKGLET
ncbi:hypothetical protein FBU59_000398, partial [Linderina macrospora]